MECPSCGSDKDWSQCADCGLVCCEGCGYSEIGKRSGDSGCPLCEVTGGMGNLNPLIVDK